MEHGLEFRRKQQQGFGKPIISADFQGKKLVAINNQLVTGNWITFHDFLIDFFKITITNSWGENSFKGPKNKLHPVIKFFRKIIQKPSSKIKQFKNLSQEVISKKSNGEIQCFLNFVYSLYEISHNNSLNKKFMKRLKLHEQFWGAYYEAFITCIMIRAGFEIDFEDESDGSKTHGEFLATDKETNKIYWVEAKFKLSKELSGEKGLDQDNYKKAGYKLFKALKKETNLERIIFIELCTPNKPEIDSKPPWLLGLDQIIIEAESSLINGKTAPEAYVCFTSQDMFCNLKSYEFTRAIYLEGFRKNDFGSKARKVTIDEALDLREKHKFMSKIFDAYKNFEVPSTFNGEIPEFAFNEALNRERLIIGNRYLIHDKEGKEVVGILRQALMMNDDQKTCTCLFETEKGSAIYSVPLNEEELRAYKQYPDTFFDKFEKTDKTAHTALDLYDLVYKAHSNNSKEKLLDFMKDWDDFESLKENDQQELAQIYSKRMAISMAKLVNID